ncbi:hypothetical protein BCV72DRAFT_67849 [Rhizopus microsporus var. microsporus]|uniref:BZIP domain-containing protein n=2 Tax=Rhizopus microsporus TaxID=58291 RepID=A0A2G4SQ44_RHIZD|nr:uncharacterized protein RHIMIDRAFT_31050 [Rhizopus microsporus ATCC 52813]ORE01709.1 hypothetical protein BCV72DRAFT_67849 [Rhizopus microsporus var. microsporus]PHZ10516.1 hypothetical protein RHIMIDRAFT_31050 [Rhizopus microsporus ATCC 52813]
MAVLPLNSSAKLDQEPNPFEQSFSGAQLSDKEKKEAKLTLPPVASITSPSPVMPISTSAVNPIIGGGILPKEVTSQFAWDSLRTGPLSPSMLQGPANPDAYYAMKPKSNSTATLINHPYRTFTEYQPVKMENTQPIFVQPQPQPQPARTTTTTVTASTVSQRKRSTSQHSEDNYSLDSNDSIPKKTTRRRSTKDTEPDEEDVSGTKKTRSKSSSKAVEDDEKRKNFLERNRIAALKCRQRKKQWLNNLQAKVEFLTSDNERLQLQSESLKEEIVNLKTLLLAHKECPVAQANGFHVNAIQKTIPSLISQPNIARPMNGVVTNNNTAYLSARMTNGPVPTSTTSMPSSQSIQYQPTSMITAPQQPSQPSMVAGGARGASGVLRF